MTLPPTKIERHANPLRILGWICIALVMIGGVVFVGLSQHRESEARDMQKMENRRSELFLKQPLGDQEKAEYDELLRRIAKYKIDHPK